MGLDFDSTNLGCGALSISFLKILESIMAKNNSKAEIICFSLFNEKKINCLIDQRYLQINSVPLLSLSNINNVFRQKNVFSTCDFIFDFTAGDSFSDIYGLKRFFVRTLRKRIAIKSKTRFVLGSQTFGPFFSFFLKVYSSKVFRRSYRVIARDSLSYDTVKYKCRGNLIKTIDVAFALPFDERPKEKEMSIGLNISGLLWNNDKSKDKINLKANYRLLIEKTISYLYSNISKNITLVPHVLCDLNNSLDNDEIVFDELLSKYPFLKKAPRFQNAIEAKSYISGFNLFIGSRMHATIASISSNVPTIAISYSRKFEGVFGDLQYKYTINTYQSDDHQCFDLLVSYIDELKKDPSITKNINKRIQNGVEELIEVYNSILFGTD